MKQELSVVAVARGIGVRRSNPFEMDAIPHDALRHWLRGERFDFGMKQWVAPAEQFAEPKPVEYEFEYGSGFGGVKLSERYRCPTCRHLVEYVR